MNYAKAFILTCIIFLFPSLSFAVDNNYFGHNIGKNIGHFYIGVQYKPGAQRFNRFSIFDDNATNILALIDKKNNLLYYSTKVNRLLSLPQEQQNLLHHATDRPTTLDALKNKGNFIPGYHPTYTDSLLGAGGIVGYSINNFRIELEAFYEKFSIKVTTGYNYDTEYLIIGTAINSNSQPTHYHCMKNTGIVLSPFLVNACYDFTLKITKKIAPYLCLGVGGDFIDFLGQTSLKSFYQAKAGVSYAISPNLTFFVDGSFHGHMNNQFSGLLVDYPFDQSQTFKLSSYESPTTYQEFTTMLAKLNVIFLTGSIGIRFVS
ncbi:P44/Msp2 family outer membrane protein [Ehrlichia minasensis]|uniref:P44/Msp2 family outer membrane protein n=1 Tax=Ehrlichia minasensis TaxID=1242993 RepID=A0A4Q6I483_9RICK|nr:P44/Msp2 family outer membrane protein [Ehrlichia minasensis]RZB12695.1 P44/Msp2 family outer membrane protein [Ehrlichia minasensis]